MKGRTIFLSASVPSEKRAEKYWRVEDAPLQIDDAVTALCRALFSRGGQLVFGGHPAISPLVAMVAGEYAGEKEDAGPATRESLVRIYQSRAFEGSLPDETLLMYRLGYAELQWVDKVGDERFQPEDPSSVLLVANSLRVMREKMIEESKPQAMVCIGGMEGVEEEFAIFRQKIPSAPVYALETTGGASAILAAQPASGLRVIDREVLAKTPRTQAWEPGVRRTIPYPMIMQMLVQEIG
jgi:hypothetical protein